VNIAAYCRGKSRICPQQAAMLRKIVFILIASLIIGSCSPITQPSPKRSAFHFARPVVAPLPTAPVAAADDSPPSVQPNFAQLVIAPLPSSDTYGQTYVSAPTTEPPNHQTIRLPIIEYHYSTFRMGDGARMVVTSSSLLIVGVTTISIGSLSAAPPCRISPTTLRRTHRRPLLRMALYSYSTLTAKGTTSCMFLI
jgi:hypothetical protein